MKTGAEVLNGLTDEQKQALLNEEIPEELEKEAQAEVDQELLTNSLYNYGYLMAAEQLGTEEGDGDLKKVASEDEIKEHNAAVEAERANIETLVADLGLAEVEDEVEFAKTAEAMAAFMFAGYSDCMVKSAAAGHMKAVSKYIGKARKGMAEAAGAAMKHGKKAVKGSRAAAGKALKMIRKHPGKAAGGAAAVGALGFLGKKMHEKHEKRAAAADSVDMALAAQEDMEKIASIEQSFEKLASHASKKGDELKKHLKGKC